MKRICTLIYLLPLLGTAQQDVEWNERIGNSDYCRAYSTATLPEGGYIIAGKTYNSENQSDDAYIAKLDMKGHLVWEKMFGANGDESASSVIHCADGGCLVAGFTGSKGNGADDAWMMKINSEGTLIWDRTFGGKLDEHALRIKQNGDAGFFICGYRMVKASSTIKAYVLLTDTAGRLQKEIIFGDWFRTYARDIALAPDGFYLCGYLHPMSNEQYKSDMGWVAKFNNEGEQQWLKVYGGDREDQFHSISTTSDGDLYVAGHTFSRGAGSSDFWLLKLNQKGDTLWQRNYGQVKHDEALAVVADKDGGCTLSGYFSSRLSGTEDVALVKYNGEGNILWERIVSGELDTRPYCLKPTPDGGWVMAGESCTKYNFDGKPVKCKSAVIKIMGTPSAGVQHYIALKVKAWEKRGEFEKSADYNQRVSEANRKKVIEKHRQEAISYYAAQAIDVDRSTLSNYDADKEVFSITIPGVGAVPVAVQIEDAQPFKSSWQSKSYTFERASFDLSGDHFILKGLDLVINGKVYSYNTEKAPGKFVYTETREHDAGTSLYRGGGDPLKGLNLSNAKEMPNGKYFALIIGVDNYKGQWRSLNNAVRDAQAIELLLKKKYRFNQFTTLYDEQATRENIINAFYRLVENAKENDNVFIYYSGHGEFDKKLNKGYWVPVDAQTRSVSAYISNSDIQTFLNGIKSKHTLLVSDACFSGDIFRGNTISVPFEESEKYYKEVSRLASRQAITSGGIEPVMDGGRDGHSVFAYYFIKALNTNDKTYLDAAQLFNAIKIPVVNNSEQTPKMQPVKNTGDEGGQFLFIKK